MGRTVGLDLDKPGICFVQWSQNSVNRYRVGHQDRYDLLYYAPPRDDASSAKQKNNKGKDDISTSLLDYMANVYSRNSKYYINALGLRLD